MGSPGGEWVPRADFTITLMPRPCFPRAAPSTATRQTHTCFYTHWLPLKGWLTLAEVLRNFVGTCNCLSTTQVTSCPPTEVWGLCCFLRSSLLVLSLPTYFFKTGISLMYTKFQLNVYFSKDKHGYNWPSTDPNLRIDIDESMDMRVSCIA